MIVVIRVALYFLFGAISGAAWLQYNPTTGQVSFYVDDLAVAVAGLIGAAGTFAVSRWAKRRGGDT
ncbi:hypothetical protein NM680_13045 [Paracoccus sp. PS-1]|uniref:hypothetical protein n=1 Tax=Paracoccus sp. PS1 TaxID=2963938 RepID=UPI0027E50871|nr:hypothetical protein [Paracoccus sp. PS1]MDQ7262289.1 hypothetical protein [Paracoccus sp. PS1]MDQ7262719.1 hypothetical protein [Paracoccus sp. PS1]